MFQQYFGIYSISDYRQSLICDYHYECILAKFDSFLWICISFKILYLIYIFCCRYYSLAFTSFLSLKKCNYHQDSCFLCAVEMFCFWKYKQKCSMSLQIIHNKSYIMRINLKCYFTSIFDQNILFEYAQNVNKVVNLFSSQQH